MQCVVKYEKLSYLFAAEQTKIKLNVDMHTVGQHEIPDLIAAVTSVRRTAHTSVNPFVTIIQINVISSSARVM